MISGLQTTQSHSRSYCTARQCSPLRRKFMECSIIMHGPSMFAVKAKIYGVLYKQSSSIAFDETYSYWSAPKTPNVSAFHWSPCGSLVSISQYFVASRVVHLPKSTETSLITESDQSGPNHQLLQLCMARTAWSDSDQAVQAVHSCNSCFFVFLICLMLPKIPLFEMHDYKHIIYFMSDTSLANCFDLSVLYINAISIIKARFHVTVRTLINKFVFYFTVRRDVKFWCSKC